MNVHPPRWTERLLQLLLDQASREAVVGDLHEAYVAIRARRSGAAARWWYYRAAYRSVLTCRVTGKRRSNARRHDYDEGLIVSVRDLARPTLRQFRDHPLYAGASVALLALAIGAGTASFAVAKHALIDPLPYRADHELVSVLTLVDGLNTPVSPHVFEDLRTSRSPFVEFAPIRPMGLAYTAGGTTQNVTVSLVDQRYFHLLGAWPATGRVWATDERNAVVLSDRFWREHLGADPSAIGRSVVLNGQPRTVVGIMPAAFVPPYFVTTDMWGSLDVAGLLGEPRSIRAYTLIARRGAHASPQDVDAFMGVFSRQLQERFPSEHGGQSWVALSLRDELVGSTKPALIGTAAGAVLVLLIVAANLAGLSTAHAVAARHHLAIRAALGATRRRLFAEQLVDSLVLALVGSALGVWMAYGLVRIVAQYQQHFLGRLAPIALDATTIALSLVAGLFIGVAAALVPRRIVGAAPADVLRTSRGSSGDSRVAATRTALVVSQVAIALVLLVGAALLVQTVQHLSGRDLGFDSRGVTWVQVNLPGQKYQSPEAQIQFERTALERVAQIAGVSSATASVGFPLWGGMMAALALKADPPGAPLRDVAYLSVSPNFVRDIGARIISGRDLSPTDTQSSERVVVINETMARMFWPAGNALGAEVQIGRGSPTERWIRVVGIMADMRAHGLLEPIRPTAFGSTMQYSWPRRHIGVRTPARVPPMLAAELRSAIHAVDPAAAIVSVSSVEQTLTNSLARHRLTMLALALFGSVSLVLCMSGLYAVITLTSQQRRREFAIRLALGARRSGVRWMVVRQAMWLAGSGALVGLVGATLGTRALQGLLQGVTPVDATTFGAAALGLLALAAVAAWHPAARAERVDPAETLRAE